MTVTVYTQPNCLPCKRVLAKLRGAEIPLEVVDLSEETHAEALNYVTNVLGSKSVPVIVSDVHPPILGYQPEKLKALITALSKADAPGRATAPPSALTMNEGNTE